jgi:hypothetical protein
MEDFDYFYVCFLKLTFIKFYSIECYLGLEINAQHIYMHCIKKILKLCQIVKNRISKMDMDTFGTWTFLYILESSVLNWL